MPKCLTSRIALTIAALRDRIRRWTRPSTRPILGYVLDRLRSPEDLVRENALLRKQLEVACRQITRPRFTRADRGMLVLLARLAPTWHTATRLVQPETIRRWHRHGFQLFWRRKSKRPDAPPRISGGRARSSSRWQGTTGSGAPSGSAGNCSSSTFASPSARSSGTCDGSCPFGKRA